MGLQVIAPPVEEPVDLADLKAALRVSHTDDDVLLAAMLAEARESIEVRTERQLARKTWLLTIDSFPTFEIVLPHRPIDSIVSVEYDDSAGLEQTMPATDYFLDNASEPGWLFPVSSWPATLSAVNAVRVTYMAGYSDPALVPGPLKSAIVLQTQELYDGPDGTRQARIRDLMQPYFLMVA
jgi:uncharacterized phiE125 gp8 family phage protein